MRLIFVFVAAVLCASACSATDESPGDASPTKTGSEIDAEIAAQAGELGGAVDGKVSGSALPPRHLDANAFPDALVERALIVSGGPPPDGIPSIDDPSFAGVDDIDWLADDEAVLFLDLDGEFRVYPTQIMVWHEIVNDDVDGHEVTVTYCPLCNSGIAFERKVELPSGESTVLDFGTSGSLYQSAMVMYDRQTESLWTHFDGRAVIGALVGVELERLPLGIASWSEVKDAHPDAKVLERPATNRDYGRNPYVGYDQSGYPIDAFFDGEVDPRSSPMARVVGFESGGESVAVTLDLVTRNGVVEIELDGERVMLWHTPGLASSLEADTVAGGSDIGTVTAFLTDEDFVRTAEGFVDDATNSTWNVLGTAVSGPREGEQLEAAIKIDTFWFAWSTYHPATTLLD